MENIATLEKEYQRAESALLELKEKMKAARAEQFKGLPASVGLKSVDSLIIELRAYASPVMKARLAPLLSSDAPSKAPKTGKRKRTTITDDLRQKIVEALKAGGKTVKQLEAKFGVSSASINNIKRDAGLTKKSK